MGQVWDNLNEAQMKRLEDFICGHTKMHYEEVELWDIIGIDPYTLNAFFPFECRMMPWSNDRIRTAYYAAVGKPLRGI